MWEGAHGERVEFLYKLKCIAMGPDHHLKVRSVPNKPNGSPTDGHVVELLFFKAAAGQKHPLAVKLVKEAGLKLFYRDRMEIHKRLPIYAAVSIERHFDPAQPGYKPLFPYLERFA